MNNYGKRYNFTKEFKLEVCEYYSNHTAVQTLKHFGLTCDATLLRFWRKEFGFLPKHAGPNPNPNRAKQTKKATKQKLGFVVKSGGYIMDGKFYGNVEFAKMQKQLKVGDTFKKVTVTTHKVGILDV